MQASIAGEFVLIMIEKRPWDGSPERVLQLQAKLNNDLAFAFDGQMARAYPESIGQPLRIRLDAEAAPDPTVARFIELAGRALRAEGLRFVIDLL